MAKANQRFILAKNPNQLKTHAKANEYPIPLKYRKEYMGNNKAKWVSKELYKKFISWLKYKGYLGSEINGKKLKRRNHRNNKLQA